MLANKLIHTIITLKLLQEDYHVSCFAVSIRITLNCTDLHIRHSMLVSLGSSETSTYVPFRVGFRHCLLSSCAALSVCCPLSFVSIIDYSFCEQAPPTS
jgi:hypothetical protein